MVGIFKSFDYDNAYFIGMKDRSTKNIYGLIFSVMDTQVDIAKGLEDLVKNLRSLKPVVLVTPKSKAYHESLAILSDLKENE